MTDENIIESNVESIKKSKKVLVLFAHPAQTRSEVNVPLFHEAKMNKHVTAVDLYAEYQSRFIKNKEFEKLVKCLPLEQQKLESVVDCFFLAE